MQTHKVNKSRSFKKDRWAWFIFLTVTILGGTSSWLSYHRRVLAPAKTYAAVQAPFSLAVLEFGRVTLNSDGVHFTAAQVEADLSLLRKQGYTPVTLAEVSDAYAKGKALPERSLLVTFDGGYLGTYECMHPVLSRLKFPAVMFLETAAQARRDAVFLFWDRLQVMLDSGIWEVGVHGNLGLPAPAAGIDPGQACFEHSRTMLETNLHGAHVQAYANLAGRTPAIDPKAPYTGPVARLAFRTDIFGVNGPQEDPLRLNRLRVQPEWTPAQLLARLDSALQAPVADGTPLEALAKWIPDQKGDLHGPNGIVLEGMRRHDVWLSGSRWLTDWELNTRMKIEAGEFWIVQEMAYGDRHWRFGGKQQMYYFQDRMPGSAPTTLNRMPQTASIYGWHDFRVIRRGPGLWVECDGKPLNQLPFQLPGGWTGNIGIIGAPVAGWGKMEVQDARVKAIPYRVLQVSADPPPAEVQSLTQQVATTAALSPKWQLRQNGQLLSRTLNHDLFEMLARRYAWDILPEVELQASDTPQSDEWLKPLAQEAKRSGWNGLTLNLHNLDEKGQAAWMAAAPSLLQELKSLGMRVVMTPRSGDGK